MKEQAARERWYSGTKSHGVTFYKTVFFKYSVDLEHDTCACAIKVPRIILQNISYALYIPYLSFDFNGSRTVPCG